jgi:hypothetical protein
MTATVESLEEQLNDFDEDVRRAALMDLLAEVDGENISLPSTGRFFNLHCHSFFSFNGYGLSPSALVWKALREGLCAIGLVDFDVLDGVDEFLDACVAAGIRGTAGLETRVFVPEFSEREMNSPGEPGISYQVGLGFTASKAASSEFLAGLLQTAQRRNEGMVDRINNFLDGIHLDYENDVLPRTPKANATERHCCEAYEAKAKELFPDDHIRTDFWAESLGVPKEDVRACLNAGPTFHGLLRSKLMKAGGPGYVRSEGSDFPPLKTVNEFVLDNAAIPAYAFLDGTTSGETDMEELLEVMTASGVAAVNIIPDRNWNFSDAELRRAKGARLADFVKLARERDLPIVVGSEMNAFGQRFIDDFDVPELAPFYDDFLAGSHILHAHTLLQRHAGMGYLSEWAKQAFAATAEKNAFFARLGAATTYPSIESLKGLNPEMTRNDLERRLGLPKE